jgi:UDP-GlcNAc:undecaprenyl-phosphate GlcNAc-1-phosphate transferase
LAEFLAIALACFLASALLTRLVRRVAVRRAWLAHPRVDRWHQESTALFGGVAIYLVFAAGLLATRPLSLPLLGLLFLSTVMFVTGLVDDVKHLRPQAKLVVQLVCGLLLYSCGYHFNDAFPWWADLFIVVFWVVAITNAMNLLDNMNGLAAGVAVIAAVFRFLWYWETGNAGGAVSSVVLVGAVAGFLVFNYPRASIFMGDAGSFTIGFALAALNLSSAESYSKSLFSILLFPVLVLAIPIFDTAFVSIARHFSGRAISRGGRDHVSHRLVAVGLSEAAAVLVLWSFSILAGLNAFVLYRVGFSYSLFIAALLCLGFLLVGIALMRVRVYEENEAPRDVKVAEPAFLLLSEFQYKRQAVWVFVDVATIVLAMYGIYLGLHGGTPEWEAQTVRFTRVAPISVASILVCLLATGLYRSDWQRLSMRELSSIALGTTLGFLVTLGLFVWGPLAAGDSSQTLAAAAIATMASLVATRLFVNVLDDGLKAGARSRSGRLVNDYNEEQRVV